MKCEFCKGNMSLEDEKCPHCGQINPHAQQHIKDMEHYKGEFDRTRWDVYTTVGMYKENAIRIIIIAALVICIVILWIISANGYSIHRSFQEKNAKRNAEKYSAMLDQYIEQEEYLILSQFCNEHCINVRLDEYDRYVPVIWVSDSYGFVCRDVMNLAAPSEYMSEERYLEMLGDDLDSFYRQCDIEGYTHYEGADRQENVEAINRMKESVLQMLQTYCGLTEEDCEGFENMSKAKRAALIEERMEADE